MEKIGAKQILYNLLYSKYSERTELEDKLDIIKDDINYIQHAINDLSKLESSVELIIPKEDSLITTIFNG